MSRTQLVNILYGLVCLIVAATSETGFMAIVPGAWKHYFAAAAVIALWLKGHWNLFINPNGTPAQIAWKPE